jgi:hypothetical protein
MMTNTSAACTIPSGDANHTFSAGLRFYRMEQFNDAAQRFMDAARIAPSLHPAWAMRAHSLAAVGRTRAAVASMREAIRLAPAIVRYRKALIRYLELLNATEEIQSELQEMISRCESDPTAWLARAETYIKMNRFEEAAADLEQAQLLRAPQSELTRVARELQVAAATPALALIHPKTRFEQHCAKELARGLKGVHGTVMAGLLAPHYSHGMVDLDVVLVCDRGVFVIECKNYSGSVEGGLNTQWHATKDGEIRDIWSCRGINPLNQVDHQVFSLLKQLRTFSTKSRLRVMGSIVFPDQAELSLGSTPVDCFDGNSITAFHLTQLVGAIAKLPPSTDPVCADAVAREAFLEFLRR